MQAHARTGTGDRQRLVDRLGAQERGPCFCTQYATLDHAAIGAASRGRAGGGLAPARVERGIGARAGSVVQVHAGTRIGPAAVAAAARVAAGGTATDQAAALAVRRRGCAERGRQQVAVVDRCIQRERLELVKVEAQLAHVAAFVLVGQRVDDRVVGGGQAVGGDHDARWLLALAQVAEQLARRLGQHQVRGLQQHLGLGAGDQRIQLRLGDVLAVGRLAGPFAAMLARQVGHIAHRGHRHGGVHEGAADVGRVVGLVADPLQPLRIAIVGDRHLRRTGPEQGGADIVEAFGRDTARGAPERVEVGRHLAHFRASHQHVTVAEVVLAVPVVIVVLVVASANHAQRIVDHQQLVVHALVEATEAAQHAGGVVDVVQPRLAEGGVVDAQFEVLVAAGQCTEDLQVGNGRELVDQHPHFDPAPGGGEQFVQHQPGAVVLVEDVGLQVDAAGGAADQVQPRDQGYLALVQDGGVMPRLVRPGFGERAAAQGAQR